MAKHIIGGTPGGIIGGIIGGITGGITGGADACDRGVADGGET